MNTASLRFICRYFFRDDKRDDDSDVVGISIAEESAVVDDIYNGDKNYDWGAKKDIANDSISRGSKNTLFSFYNNVFARTLGPEPEF